MVIEHNKTVNKSTLKSEYGFTEKLINDFLPEPQEKTNPMYKCASPMLLWNLEDVLTVMETLEFQEAQEKTKARQKSAQKAVERKRAKTKVLFDEKIAAISVKKKSDQNVVRLAIESWREWNGDYETPCDEFEKATVDRWTVNYIRHHLTDYDKTLYEGKGVVGTHEEYKRYREAVLDKIAETYPQYAEECEWQKIDRMTGMIMCR